MSQQQELTGKHAEIMIGGVKIIDAYDVTVEITNTFVEPRPFGQTWKRRIPDEADFTVSAKRYSVPSSIAAFLDLPARTPAATVAATVIVYYEEGNASSRVFEGPVWVEKGTFQMPAGLIDEDLTLLASDKPTYVAGYTPS